jgi:peptide/nickel transport system permease protein
LPLPAGHPADLPGLLAVTFFIGRVIPVDPVLAIVGDRAPEHVVARVREEMGLNKPLYAQFCIYLGKVCRATSAPRC